MQAPRLLFVNILLIACLTNAAINIYSPSLAAIAHDLNTSISQAQLSLTIFMVGLALSQLLYGPISEGIGRRMPLIIGVLVFLAGSLFCFFATEIHTVILGRFIQGLGVGACSALWRSVFRDIYEGNELSQYSAYLSITIIFIVPAIPVLGGYLQHFLGWRASFGFLIIYGITALILLIYTFSETSQHHHVARLNKTFIIQSFKQLLTSRLFMGYGFAVFFCYGAYFSWFAIGPVLLIKTVGLSPVEFGWASFLTGAAAMSLAGAINGRVVGRFGGRRMLRFGWTMMILSGGFLALGNWLFGVNLYAVLFPVFLFSFGVNFIWPNTFAGAFTPFGTIAGYAGSLYSFMQLGGGAVVGSLSTLLPKNSAYPLAAVFVISPMLAWITYEVFVNPKKTVLSNPEA